MTDSRKDELTLISTIWWWCKASRCHTAEGMPAVGIEKVR
jgi:hypothetical protein